MRRAHHDRRWLCSRASGYTLIEALLLTVILGIVAVVVGEALVASTHGAQANENTLLIDNTLVSQMETLRATWQSYPIGATTSQITIGNSSYTMTRDIEKANPNGLGNQASFLSLSIQIAGRTMYTYVNN